MIFDKYLSIKLFSLSKISMYLSVSSPWINKGISLISEIKKASPSAGILINDFNHLDIAKMYINNGATCLSVLTEEKYFLGKLDYIQDIKKKI